MMKDYGNLARSLVKVQPLPQPKTKIFYMNTFGGNKMFRQEFTYAKEWLLSTIKENRTEHAEIVKEAKEGYKVQLKKVLEDKLQALEKGEIVDTMITLREPESHIGDYDCAIAILNACQEEEIKMDDEEFQKLVMDNWHWQNTFLDSMSRYSMSARTKVRRV